MLPVDANTDCELDFTCPNRDCTHYRTIKLVVCHTDFLNSTSPVDDRDLDCECGERLVQHELLGCESYTPEEIARRQAVGEAVGA